MSRSTQGHHLKEFGSTRVPIAAHQVSRSSAFLFWSRRFFKVLPYMGMVAILVMWPWPFEGTFIPPSQRSSVWNLTLIGPMVSEEKMFKECGQWTEDGQRRPTYPISSPVSLWLRWAKNRSGLCMKARSASCIKVHFGFSFISWWIEKNKHLILIINFVDTT